MNTMRCINCTTRILRVFINGPLPITRPHAPPRNLQLLQQLRRNHTGVQDRPLTDDDYLPMVSTSVNDTQSWLHKRGHAGPPPSPPQQVDFGYEPEVILREPRSARGYEERAERPVREYKPRRRAAPESEPEPEQTRVYERSPPREYIPQPRSTSTSTSESPAETLTAAELDVELETAASSTAAHKRPDPAAHKLRTQSNKTEEDASWEAYISTLEELQSSSPPKRDPLAKREKRLAKIQAEKEERLAKRKAREEAASKPPPKPSRNKWSLPQIAPLPDYVSRLEAHVGEHNRRDIPRWQLEKLARAKKLGGAPWRPEKRLSPEAMDGIRTLNAQHPDEFNTATLAELFEVTPESIRRILKNKWTPNKEEMAERMRRWEKRMHSIIDHQKGMDIRSVIERYERMKADGRLGRRTEEGPERLRKERRRTDGRREHEEMVRNFAATPVVDV